MGKTKNILLIEDSPDDIEFIKRAIKRDSHETQVLTIMDGQEAADLLHKQGKYESDGSLNFDLIFVDIKLPKISGLELLKLMRQDNGISITTPIIMFTSSKDPNDILTASEYGANSYIQKPISYKEFEHTIHTILEYWFDIDIFRTAN
jgi:two-component system response regulator